MNKVRKRHFVFKETTTGQSFDILAPSYSYAISVASKEILSTYVGDKTKVKLNFKK